LSFGANWNGRAYFAVEKTALPTCISVPTGTEMEIALSIARFLRARMDKLALTAMSILINWKLNGVRGQMRTDRGSLSPVYDESATLMIGH